ncbi:MAG: hypothetical protein CUN49_16620, partial [Candidatus Thermofonsia Clade 1 bacterium]
MSFEHLFRHLDEEAQKILQTLAIYGRSVTPRAVSHVLRPFLPHLDSIRAEGRLEQLANDYPSVVRREHGQYALGEAEARLVLSTIELGEPS